MSDAISFSLTFPTSEVAIKFVTEVTRVYKTPCLRYGVVVYLVEAEEQVMINILALGMKYGCVRNL